MRTRRLRADRVRDQPREDQSMPNIAVVGCGYWGKNIVRNLHALGALSHVCECSPAGRQLARELAPGARIADDVDQALADPSVAGVMIATPAATHFDQVSRALKAGKHVFVEKPLALAVDQGRRLVELARDHRRVLMVGHLLEYHPAVVRLCQLVRDGVLGRIQYIYSNRLNLGKIRREENILWSFAPHDVAVIIRLTGQLPFEVVATGGSYVQPNVADVTVSNLLFDNGVRAHVFVSWLHPYKEQRLVVVGSEKMAVFNDTDPEHKLVLFHQKVDWIEGQPVPVKGEPEPVPVESEEPLRLECQHFLDCIADRRRPLTDGESGVRVLLVLQAAQRSMITQGEPVRLPLETSLWSGHQGVTGTAA